jgi:hypothetical protein
MSCNEVIELCILGYTDCGTEFRQILNLLFCMFDLKFSLLSMNITDGINKMSLKFHICICICKTFFILSTWF